MNNLKIYTVYHINELYHPYKLFESDIIKPINIKNIITDNDNFLIKYNSQLSEFATMFYIWKNNIKSDYIGFQHYGKKFSLKQIFTYGNQCHKFNEDIKNYNIDNLDDNNIFIFSSYPYKDIEYVFKNIKNVLYEEDYMILENYILNNYNDLYDKFKNLSFIGNDSIFLRFECFICKWEYFDQYMKFIIGLFNEFGLNLLDDNEQICLSINNIANKNTFILKQYVDEHFYGKNGNNRKIAFFIEFICALYFYLMPYKLIQNYKLIEK